MKELLAVTPDEVVNFIFEWAFTVIIAVVILGVVCAYLKDFLVDLFGKDKKD